MTHKIYYSVDNGGDGSAYPIFFTKERCAEIHQELLSEHGEGWGEPCTGSISFDVEGTVIFNKQVNTVASYIKELEGQMEWAKEKKKKDILKYIEELKALPE